MARLWATCWRKCTAWDGVCKTCDPMLREEESTETHGHITSLAVARSHRKLGLATKLMSAARTWRCLRVVLIHDTHRHGHAGGLQRRLQLAARPRHQQGRPAPLHADLGIQVRVVQQDYYKTHINAASTTWRKSTMQTGKTRTTCASGSSRARAPARRRSRRRAHRSARRTCITTWNTRGQRIDQSID